MIINFLNVVIVIIIFTMLLDNIIAIVIIAIALDLLEVIITIEYGAHVADFDVENVVELPS